MLGFAMPAIIPARGPATTWNPSDKAAGITLSGGNLTATGSGAAYASVRSNTYHDKDKHYWEQKVTAIATPAGPFIGFGTSAFTLAAQLGNSSVSYGQEGFGPFQQGTGGGLSISGTATATAVNDIMQGAIDFDAGKFWIGKNNTWLSSGNPAAGTNPYGTFTANQAFYIAFCAFNSSNAMLLLPGYNTFNYTPPAGFRAWGW